MLTELTAFQHTATDRQHRVVLALRQTAVIAVDLGLRRSARDTGVFVGRVAHSGCGPLGEDRLIDRPRFRGEIPFERGHLVRALRPLRHAAAALAFRVVGFGAVLIQQKQRPLGLVLEFLGAQPDRVSDEIDFDLRASQGVDRGRDAVHRLAHDLDVLTVDHPAGKRQRSARQHRLERFPDQRAARPQCRRLIQATTGLRCRDSPPERQHLTPGLGAHLLGRRLGLQTRQHAMTLGR